MSKTTRSAIIGEKRFESAFRQAPRSGFRSQPVHGFGQPRPGRAAQPVVLLHRRHDSDRAAFFVTRTGAICAASSKRPNRFLASRAAISFMWP